MKKIFSILSAVCLSTVLFLSVWTSNSYAKEEEPYWKATRDLIIMYGMYGYEGTIVFDGGGALPLEIIQVLKCNPKVSFEFKCTYNDTDYDIFIPAGEVICDESISWYGPELLASQYGNRAANTESEKAVVSIETAPSTNGEYVVVKGDTLGKIAVKFNTTVANLKALNPEIKDINKIYPGNIIKY